MKNRLFGILMIVSCVLRSQNFSITQGKEFADPDRQLEVLFIGADENNNYLLRHDRPAKGYYKLSCFDRTTSAMTYEKVIKLDEEETVVEQVLANDKIILVTKAEKKSSSKIFFLIRTLNATTGEFVLEKNVLEEVEAANENKLLIQLIIKFSPDAKNMLVVLNDKNNRSAKITAKLYDTNVFKKTWEKQSVEVFEKSSTAPLDYQVDNAGNFIYQIGYLRQGSTEEKKDIAYAICISPPGNITTNFIKLPTENKTLINSNLEFLGSEIICRGEFIDGINKKLYQADGKTMGFFMYYLDIKNLQLTSQSYDYFSSNIQDKLDDWKPNFKHHKSYYIDKELYVVAYGYHATDYYKSGEIPSPKTYLSSSHSSEDILVLKYSAAKKLEWMRIMPHNTVGNADIIQVVCTKKIHLLYQDINKNLEKYPDVNVYKKGTWKLTAGLGKSALTVCVSIDKDGVMKREIVQPEEANTHLMDFGPDRVKPSSPLPLKFTFDKKMKIARMDLLTISN